MKEYLSEIKQVLEEQNTKENRHMEITLLSAQI